MNTYRRLFLNALEARESKFIFERNYFEFIKYFSLFKFVVVYSYYYFIKTKIKYIFSLEFRTFGSFYAPRQADSLLNGFLIKSEL